MDFETIHDWDDSLWEEAEKIYEQAFPEHSRKKKQIIKRMFEKKMCYLHFAFIDHEVVAMALSGKVEKPGILILDYIAVKEDMQNQGIGRHLIDYLKSWSQFEEKFTFIVVEVEAGNTVVNEKRIQFWRKCGFQLTDYIHSYIWVPEKYRAMFYCAKSEVPNNINGELLFSYITKFHKEGYRG